MLTQFFNRNFLYVVLGFISICLLAYVFFIRPPASFPEGAQVVISEGKSISEVARILSEKNIIGSASAFTLLVRLINPKQGVLAHTYAFPERENVISLAFRLSSGITGIEPIKVTIPEGLSSREMGPVLAHTLPGFDSARFKALAEAHEGYLFPDTYYFLPGVSPEAIIQAMRENFNAKLLERDSTVRDSGRTLEDIVTMASILEEEARTAETRKIISGILWKRLELKMPLQVDAVFGYILGKSGYAPTFDDLEIESAYNTYLNRGLPPGAISNPGLVSIDAALEPTETDYLYYLTGADGVMYYAETFEQHKANRTKLR